MRKKLRLPLTGEKLNFLQGEFELPPRNKKTAFLISCVPEPQQPKSCISRR